MASIEAEIPSYAVLCGLVGGACAFQLRARAVESAAIYIVLVTIGLQIVTTVDDFDDSLKNFGLAVVSSLLVLIVATLSFVDHFSSPKGIGTVLVSVLTILTICVGSFKLLTRIVTKKHRDGE